MQLAPPDEFNLPSSKFKVGRPALALVTLVPLVWLLAVTMTAGVQKIFHPDARIGFLAQVKVLDEKRPALQQAVTTTQAAGDEADIAAAQKALATNRTLRFNNVLDAVVAGVFLVLVVMIVAISVTEWALLLSRVRRVKLHETQPVWLDDYARAEGQPLKLLGLLALGIALVKELSGEAAVQRAQQVATSCQCGCGTGVKLLQEETVGTQAANQRQIYERVIEEKFRSVNRCC
jgi:carbon starvation protein